MHDGSAHLCAQVFELLQALTERHDLRRTYKGKICRTQVCQSGSSGAESFETLAGELYCQTPAG